MEIQEVEGSGLKVQIQEVEGSGLSIMTTRVELDFDYRPSCNDPVTHC